MAKRLNCSTEIVSSTLLINATIYSVSTIAYPVKGSGKFNSITSINNKAYFTFHISKFVLVLDSLDESTRTMELPKGCEEENYQWCRLTVFKKKLLVSPYNSHCILVINTETDTTYSINFG